MILYRNRNNPGTGLKPGLKNEPYIVINLVFAVIIILVFIYSAIFTPEKENYPVACIHEKITGQPCISCGLSHSFSLIVRGKIEEAREWNAYGLRVFLFFGLQLLMRSGFSILYLSNWNAGRKLIIFDSAVSLMLFIITFLPFTLSIFKLF